MLIIRHCLGMLHNCRTSSCNISSILSTMSMNRGKLVSCHSRTYGYKLLAQSKPTHVLETLNSQCWYSTVKHSKLKKFQKTLLPFEKDTKVPENVLLYSNDGKETIYLMLSSLGVFLFGVLMNSAYTVYTTMRDVDPLKDDNYPWWHWWRRVNLGGGFIRTSVTVLLGMCGCLVLAFSMLYPARVVKGITLLRGGEAIILSTYRPFGRVVSRELPLGNISAQWGGEDTVEQLPIKIKGQRFQYVINQNAVHHNRELFEQTIALRRGF